MSRSFDVPEPLPLSEQHGQTYPVLVKLMQRLLGEGGCPWDREQDMKSLRRYVLEEACEVIDAIDENDPVHIEEELGDLLFTAVNLARHLKIDPELALRKTNAKFRLRFAAMEQEAGGRAQMEEMPAEELEKLWGRAKDNERLRTEEKR